MASSPGPVPPISCRVLRAHDIEAAARVIGQGFIGSEPMSTHLGIPESEMTEFARRYCEIAAD